MKKPRSYKSVRNSRGMSLIEVMVAAAIMTVIAMGIMSITSMLSKQQRNSNLAFQASMIRNSLIQTLNNNKSWINTYKAAQNRTGGGAKNMDCLATSIPPAAGVPCTTDEATDSLVGGTPITAPSAVPTSPPANTTGVIYQVYDSGATVDAAGNITNGVQPMYDRTAASYGYNVSGIPCHSFGSGSPDARDACPLRFDITWEPKCSAAVSCINPQILVKIIAQYNPGNNVTALNPANYSASFVQGSTGIDCWTYLAGSLYETCGNVGIGTTGPIAALDVSGNFAVRSVTFPNADLTFTASNGTNGYSGLRSRVDQTNGWELDTFGSTMGTNAATYFTGPNGAALVNVNNAPLALGANNAQAIMILPSGNVGLGSATPAAKLDVVGTMAMNRNYIYLAAANDTNHAIHNITGSDGEEFRFYNFLDLVSTAGGMTAVHILSNGQMTVASNITGNGALTIAGAITGNSSLNIAGGITGNSALSIAGGISGGSNMNIAGNIVAGGTVTGSSDARLKKDITPIASALDKILSLQGIYFRWKDPKKPQEMNIGFTAQNVEKAFPEAVLTDKDGFKSVAYQNLTAPLVEAVREQQKQIEELKKQNKEQAAQLKSQQELLTRFMKENASRVPASAKDGK